jgi:soluble lytic murein transglycosylase
MTFKAWLYLAGGVVFTLIPYIAAAAGLVPCGQGSNPDVYGALSCNLCYFGELIQNIINFLVGISIPISVIMFGYAGILMFTNAESLERVARGKKIFQSVFIGFVLVICGWLIVQTVLGVIVEDDFNFVHYWNGLHCDNKIREDTTKADIDTFINGVLGTTPPPSTVSTGGDITYNCDKYAGFTLQGSSCVGPNGSIPATATLSTTGGGTLSQAELQARLANTEQYAEALQQACKEQGLQNCDYAQAQMALESNGNPNAESSAGCVGLMQVCPNTARALDPSLAGLSDAQVVEKLKDPTYNMQLGTQLDAQLEDQYNGDTTKMSAAYNGGSDANSTSVRCGGGAAWQCTKNSGWAETRNYVPNVNNAVSILDNQ